MNSNDRRRIAVVVTTISKGGFLNGYVRAIKHYPFPDNVSVYVIGDANTPSDCRSQADAARANGVNCKYFDLQAQEEFLEPLGAISKLIPERSDNRRNVGYLMAFADRNDVIISVDDDNIPLPEYPFFKEHGAVGTIETLNVAVSKNRWFNLGCLLYSVDPYNREVSLYPRGFPFNRRFSDHSFISQHELDTGFIGVNLGLWTADPDIDAAQRLTTRCKVLSVKAGPCFLSQYTRSPINSQNTAICWWAVPAFYFAPMGYKLDGISIGRFGDIFSGYFVQLCAESVGHKIRIGQPIVRQMRNAHDLFEDLTAELPGMRLIEKMIDLLEEPLPPKQSYSQAYLALADRLEQWSYSRPVSRMESGQAEFLRELTMRMRSWVEACRVLVGGEAGLLVPKVD